MDKQLVFVERIDFDFFDLFDDVSLDDSVINLSKFKDQLDKKYTDNGMIVGKVQVSKFYDDFDCYIYIHRWETDEEYATRIQQELEKAEQRRLKKERKAAAKAEKAKVDAQKELEELEELRKRVAELEQKHNITLE